MHTPNSSFNLSEPRRDDVEARVWAEYLERPGLRGAYDCQLARGAAGWEVVECDRRLPR